MEGVWGVWRGCGVCGGGKLKSSISMPTKKRRNRSHTEETENVLHYVLRIINAPFMLYRQDK